MSTELRPILIPLRAFGVNMRGALLSAAVARREGRPWYPGMWLPMKRLPLSSKSRESASVGEANTTTKELTDG